MTDWEVQEWFEVFSRYKMVIVPIATPIIARRRQEKSEARARALNQLEKDKKSLPGAPNCVYTGKLRPVPVDPLTRFLNYSEGAKQGWKNRKIKSACD